MSLDGIAARDVWHALEDAEASLRVDARQIHGAGPLAGLVVGVKANIAVEGQGWTAGIGARAGMLAERDAPVVARLRAAGATILSRLAMDEAALGATGDNPHFGTTLNPAAPGHSPGGSSCGSAAAVAGGLADAALGTDTLGSVRIPAACCGLWGLKPAHGALPVDGVVPLAPSLDTLGVLAADPATLRAVATALGLGMDAPATGRVLVPEVTAAPEPLAARDRAAQALARAGVEVMPVTLQQWEPGQDRRAAFIQAETEAAPILSGHPGLSPALEALIAYGAAVLAARRTAIRQRLAGLAEATRGLVADGAALLLPTLPCPVPRQDKVPGRIADFTALANIAGLPALAVPMGGKPPASIQLVGAAGAEGALLALGAALHASR